MIIKKFMKMGSYCFMPMLAVGCFAFSWQQFNGVVTFRSRGWMDSPWFMVGAGLFFVFLSVVKIVNDIYLHDTPEELAEVKAQKLASIQPLLQREMTPQEVKDAFLNEYSFVSNPVKAAQPLISEFENWLEKFAQPDDKLYFYDTDEDSWHGLCGENGFAIVRNGAVVEFWSWEEN